VHVLDYDASATLPPGSAEDICKWLQIFNNAGTASNYLAHVRWACKAYNKGTDWSNSQVTMVLRGLRKMDLRTRLSQIPEKMRLEENDVLRLICLASNLGDNEFSVLACWSYHFLLRVQSEALGLEAGNPADAQTRLPSDRHSAVWVQDDQLFMKLRKRKHRPAGSLLIRSCTCGSGTESRTCPVHCLSLRYTDPGSQIFPGMTGTKARKKLTRYLTMMRVPSAQSTTLKVFRASRATNLALQGKPLAHILQAGEWKSAAVLAYASEEAFDRGAFLHQTLIQSDDEADAEAP
jgi:hypothetical protein